MRISHIDHLVLTVADIPSTVDWYQRVLGMRPVTFAGERHALAFGRQKLNLHQAGRELEPKAARPVPGSADLCLISTLPLAEVQAHLHACGVRVEQGPVARTGATGPIASLYVRDPDGNLIEIATYHPARSADPDPRQPVTGPHTRELAPPGTGATMTESTSSREQNMRDWLRQHGAETIEHPGGNLYAHLSRVCDRLGRLGLDDDTRLAGLAHAVYGTDGFDVVLLDRQDRTNLREIVGERVEDLVYRYGGCDRNRTWQRLAETGEVFNRFTNQTERPDRAKLRSFVDLSIVNELDVMEQAPSIIDEHGEYFRELFTAWATIASPQVTADAQQVLGVSS